MTEAQLVSVLHISIASARRLRLALTLHRRLLVPGPERVSCTTPEEIVAIMRPLVLLDHERLWCLGLDARLRLLGEPIEVARGDVDGTDASARAVCRAALRCGAASQVVVHNHPSGDPQPSRADCAVTRIIAVAGLAIGVPLKDHLIVTADGRWCSLRRDRPEAFL